MKALNLKLEKKGCRWAVYSAGRQECKTGQAKGPLGQAGYSELLRAPKPGRGDEHHIWSFLHCAVCSPDARLCSNPQGIRMRPCPGWPLLEGDKVRAELRVGQGWTRERQGYEDCQRSICRADASGHI